MCHVPHSYKNVFSFCVVRGCDILYSYTFNLNFKMYVLKKDEKIKRSLKNNPVIRNHSGEAKNW